MSFTNEQLDTVLFHMASNSKEIPLWPDVICKNAGLDLQRETSYLLLDKLRRDGYVDKTQEGTYYSINGEGLIFKGYAQQDRLRRNSRNWKTAQNVILAISAALSLFVAVRQCSIAKKANDIQIQINKLKSK